MGDLIQRILVLIQILNECSKATLIRKLVVLVGAFVDQLDMHTGVQKRELPQSTGEYLVVEFDVPECLSRRFEVALGAARIRVSDHLEGLIRYAVMVNLLVALTFTPHGEPELLGKRVDDRDTDAM